MERIHRARRKHRVAQSQPKTLLSQITSRPTPSRRRGVDLADKVTKRVRLKWSESIWVSDLKKGDFRSLPRGLPLSNLATALWDRAFAPLGARTTPRPSVPAGQYKEHSANRWRPVGGEGGGALS